MFHYHVHSSLYTLFYTDYTLFENLTLHINFVLLIFPFTGALFGYSIHVTTKQNKNITYFHYFSFITYFLHHILPHIPSSARVVKFLISGYKHYSSVYLISTLKYLATPAGTRDMYILKLQYFTLGNHGHDNILSTAAFIASRIVFCSRISLSLSLSLFLSHQHESYHPRVSALNLTSRPMQSPGSVCGLGSSPPRVLDALSLTSLRWDHELPVSGGNMSRQSARYSLHSPPIATPKSFQPFVGGKQDRKTHFVIYILSPFKPLAKAWTTKPKN